MRLLRSLAVLVGSTAAAAATALVGFGQPPAQPSEIWSPERVHAWVVHEFQSEPDVAALIREVIASHGEGRKDRAEALTAKYLALWDERYEAIRRRAPARPEERPTSPLEVEARIQALFNADPVVRELVQAIVAADRRDPSSRAVRDLKARYDALWKARYDELRRRVTTDEAEGAPAGLEGGVLSAFQRDPSVLPLISKAWGAGRALREAERPGGGRTAADLKDLARRRDEASAEYEAAWRGRYAEFRRRILAGTDAFASWRIGAAAGEAFMNDPDVAAVQERISEVERERARTLDPVPSRRDEAARKTLDRRKADLEAQRDVLWNERQSTYQKQAVAQVQAEFGPAAPPEGGDRTERSQRNKISMIAPSTFFAGAPEPYLFAPTPKTIAVRVSGTARDDRGAPAAGARVTLYAVPDDGVARPAATATTGADGRYEFEGVRLPVVRSLASEWESERSARVRFLASAEAPGKGIAWGEIMTRWQYDLANRETGALEPQPFLRSVVGIDLKLGSAAALHGKLVDDEGGAIAGATVRVADFAELLGKGDESGEVREFAAGAFPEGVGRARTGADGGFRIEGLTEGFCYRLVVVRPDAPGVEISLYAATRSEPGGRHRPPFSTHGGRGGHDARENPVSIALARPRPVIVHVAAEDDGRPVPGARIELRHSSASLSYRAAGATDARGDLRLSLPPLELGLVRSRPPEESRYLETYLLSNDAAPATVEIRQKVGAELILEAVEAETGAPMADVFFWWTADAPPAAADVALATLADALRMGWTDEEGALHVAVPAAPGLRCRFEFAAMRAPNATSLDTSRPQTYGYTATPARSEPVEIVAGEPIRLRFALRKGPPEPNPNVFHPLTPAPIPRPTRPPGVL